MNHSQKLERNSDEIQSVLIENTSKTKKEVKKILMDQFDVSDKTAGRYYDRFVSHNHPILELSDNKKEVNTMLTRSLISVINDINLLPIECDEDIEKQVELLKKVAETNNLVKTY